MGENEHQSREWSIDIDQGNNVEEVLEPGLDCCIYRVPNILRRINEEAYSPGFISIGPLHYGRRELLGMEKQKTRFLSKFKERVNAEKLEEFKTYINNQEQHIRDHYAVSSTLESSEYVAMVLNDAVFIIELFVRNSRGPHDFLLEISQLNIFIRRDLLVLENQIPYFVLDHLYSSAFSNKEGYPSFFVLCLNFFGAMAMFNWSFSEQLQVKHFTDLLRRAVVLEVQPTVQSVGFICDLPCATKLNKSGLEFKGIEGKCLHEIKLEKRKHGKWLPWFAVNELQIPRIIISNATECYFRNLMALEMFHYQTQSYICHYVDLMDHLIDTTKDVDLLIEKGIIVNCVGDIEAITKMFNSLCSHIALRGSLYYEDAKKMKVHYKYPWNHLKATLKSVYFSNLWTGTATVAAAFLLILTAIQTICSVNQVRNGTST